MEEPIEVDNKALPPIEESSAEEVELKHWKSLRDDRFIGSHTLIERGLKELEVTIIDVKKETLQSIGFNARQQDVTLAYLEGEKPLWLNKINQQTIERVLKTPFVKNWSGQKITLFVDRVKVTDIAIANIEDMFVDALRVREFSTKDTAETLDLFHPKWERIIQALKAKSITIEQLKSKYVFDKSIELELLDINTN